ncbi:2,3-bisphosphoglycerate-dependent phosphoglycerate mutase isoform X1 [Drosophila bipectinata]|uniref:2,3-bisphosphoglycerate-dependent phosphoglycerate mutase isoform X1 n=1 Tax=Drosophila bipectinata TaxID=42026 RepID=UPI0007E85EBE|nr:2,3-bisphosphoglycerate-dependent phosphoglycerate mutase isoform X1 [Drosophila bipectinata]
MFKFLKSKLSQFIPKQNRLVILRHGESDFNIGNRFCGWHDAPLSDIGVKEALTVAVPALQQSKLEFDMVYTSVLSRSRETADMILSNMSCSYVPVKEDWRLSERHYGNLTGQRKREVANMYGEEQVMQWRRAYDVAPPPILESNRYFYTICSNPIFDDVPPGHFPLTESMHMCVDRVTPVWHEVRQEVLKGTRVLMVVHGTVARALVQLIEGVSNDAIEKINIANCVPRVYEFDLTAGKLIGGGINLGNPDYIKRKVAEVAAIGD